MLEIRNLHVRVGEHQILKGVNLAINAGEVHSIMGPNGSGKSTLAGVLAGREEYEVTAGEIRYLGRSLVEMAPEERAQAGLFLAFQYPVEIPGVNNVYFLKAALNAIRKARGEDELDAMDFLALARAEDEAPGDGRQAPEPVRQRGILRRLEEARRNPANGRPRAGNCYPR